MIKELKIENHQKSWDTGYL